MRCAVNGRRGDGFGVQCLRDLSRASPLRIQGKDTPHHCRCGRIDNQPVVVGGVLAVAVQRKAGDVAPAVPFVVQHSPHIAG